MSSPCPLHRLATQHCDERYKRKQSESFLSQPENTIWISRHRTLRTQYLHLGIVFMYSFTHTNIVFLFRHLPTEIAIFINVCYQMKCFGGDSFSFFLGTGFANIPPTFLISCEVGTRYSKTLKYSEQYIRDHLSPR